MQKDYGEETISKENNLIKKERKNNND